MLGMMFKLLYLTVVLVSYGALLADDIDAGTLNDLGNSRNTERISNQINSPVVEPLYRSSDVSSEPPNMKLHKTKRYKVASFDFDHVASPFIITAWIFVACCAKIAFHVSPRLANYCPESCMLLLVGVIIGLVLFHSGMSVGPLTPNVFFLFMLPPIVFEAGYFMPNRLFFDNIISILVYAVVGTVWNALSIGFTLWAIGLSGIFGYDVPLMDMLLFSSIVSAVDPVAVLAVFEEIHVNDVLYIIVFGESLLNDAVTVVLYHMFEGYTEMGVPNILPIDYFAGVASFFVVSVGGTLIGIVFGILTAFLSRFTRPVAVIEPMFPFIMGYMAYLFAEMFHLSGILSLVFCGITMKNYVEENISKKSHVTVKYVTKMLATVSETIIFVVLGVSTVNNDHEWNTWFVLSSILFCSIYRAIGIVVLTAFLNQFRLHQLNGVEQFIMSYGGLRGAVAFALALIIDEGIIPSKKMMVTTIIAVVYFTVFVQGMTIKFFVRILKVPRKSDRELTMNERLHITVIDHVMGGIEEIADQFLGNNKIRDRFKYYNNKYLRRYLTNHSQVNEPKIFETHSRLNLLDAMNMVNSGSKVTIEPGLPLSTVLRNYTQANLARLSADEVSPSAVESNLLNIDMGELTYNPSFKDLADSEIHHILEDAMFKPVKRPRRYSRSQFYDSEPKHPPFHHHTRLQIRRLISESRRRRKKSRLQPPPNGCSVNGSKMPISTIYLNSGPNHPRVTVTSAGQEENEDDGIIFTAKNNSLAETDEPPVRTLTETVLPWKRENDMADCDPARPQEEFPTWVNNREYYPSYMSPTHTFLESLRDHEPSGLHTIYDSLDESDDCFEDAPNTPPSVEEIEQKENDQHQVANEENTPVIQYQPRSPATTQERRQYFRNSSAFRRSPDRFSLNSSLSEDTSRPGSSDIISIECPDVALDLENETDTKL